MLGQVGRAWRAAVLAMPPDLPRASGCCRLYMRDFCTSIDRLAWAQANGCDWTVDLCDLVAAGGHLEMLQWAVNQGCPCDATTCACAALVGRCRLLPGWPRLDRAWFQCLNLSPLDPRLTPG